MLSAKQLNKLASFRALIVRDLARREYSSRYRPDRTIFQKVVKWVEVWALNAVDKNALDALVELQTLMYDISKLNTGPFDLTGLIRVTTTHHLEQCQLMLVKGLVENGISWSTSLKSQSLLPTVNSYVQLIS